MSHDPKHITPNLETDLCEAILRHDTHIEIGMPAPVLSVYLMRCLSALGYASKRARELERKTPE